MPLLRVITAWWFVIIVSVAGVSATADGIALVVAGQSAGAIAVVVLTHLALALIVGFAIALPLSAAEGLDRRLASRPRVRHLFGPAVGAVVVFAMAWLICDPLGHDKIWVAYLAVVLMASAATAACIWVLRAKADPPQLRPLACFGLGVAVAVGDSFIPSSTYFEFHVTLHLTACIAILCGCDSARRWVRRRGRPVHALALSVGLAAAVAHLLFVDQLFPGWRGSSLPITRKLAAITHVLRKTVDFDGDGYSAVAWGTDCDDFDRSRHPLVVDLPGGGDTNCNGIDPPAVPSASDRGLTPAKGTASLPRGSVDLVILMTVDALRADCLQDDLMPATAALARRGITFETMYSAGSGTLWSVPLMLMADEQAVPITLQLRDEGVTVSAFTSGNGNIDYDALGFPGLSDEYLN